MSLHAAKKALKRGIWRWGVTTVEEGEGVKG
jgi:hypothetical protein